jgi:hypothetical protein
MWIAEDWQDYIVETWPVLRVAAAVAIRLLHLCQMLKLEGETGKVDATGVRNEDCQFKVRLQYESQKISSFLVEAWPILRVTAALAIRLLHLELWILDFDDETGKVDAVGPCNEDCPFKVRRQCESQKIPKLFSGSLTSTTCNSSIGYSSAASGTVDILEFDDETGKVDAVGPCNKDYPFKVRRHCESQKISKPFGWNFTTPCCRDIIWWHEQGSSFASVSISLNWTLQSSLVHANTSGCHTSLGVKLYSQR